MVIFFKYIVSGNYILDLQFILYTDLLPFIGLILGLFYGFMTVTLPDRFI